MDGLTESEAVSQALWNNASFGESLSDLGVSRADLVQAGLLTNPVLSLLFPVGPKQLEFAITFPLEALWLRPRRVAMAELNYERVGQQLVQNGLDLVRDVRVAFTDARLAESQLRLARAAADLNLRLAELSEKRLQAGDVSELEAGTVRIAAHRAREQAAHAAHEVLIAKQRLATLIGLATPAEELMLVAPDAPQDSSIEVDVAVHSAWAARPDLRAAELAIEVAAKRAGLAREEIVTISAILDANAKGSEGFEIGPGIQATLPVFDQGQGKTARADAELSRAIYAHEKLKRQITLDVREAHVRRIQAGEQLSVLRGDVLPALEQATKLSERAYASGGVSYFLVLENSRQLVDARLREVNAVAELERANAQLERSIGRRLTDIAGRAPTPAGESNHAQP